MKKKTEPKLCGVSNINSCIQNYLDEHFGYINSRMDTDFAYMFETDTISWTLVVSEKNNKEFKEFFESLGCEIKADIFIYSLFHEIGHAETFDDVSDEEYEYSMKRKEEDITSQEYFNLPDEITATRWAVEYLNAHTKEIASFWNELQPLIIEFYNKNHIL